MFKLIKYELRSNFLMVIGICTIVIIAHLILITRLAGFPIEFVNTYNNPLSLRLTIFAMMVIFIYSLTIMYKYLYQDSGYLLFTLPQSGMSIIASRLITALIEITIVAFVAIFISFFSLDAAGNKLIFSDKIIFSLLKNYNIHQIPIFIISYISIIFYSLISIYFCLVIGRIAIKTRKIGIVSIFINFIIISLAINWVLSTIMRIFPQILPQTLNLGGAFNINIASTIFNIITFVGFFMTTCYLIDKKLEL
jgi:ABC-2 type transport system permease protein